MGLTYPCGDRTILIELLLQEVLQSSLYSFLPCSTFLCNIISKTNNLHSFLPISQSCLEVLSHNLKVFHKQKLSGQCRTRRRIMKRRSGQVRKRRKKKKPMELCRTHAGFFSCYCSLSSAAISTVWGMMLNSSLTPRAHFPQGLIQAKVTNYRAVGSPSACSCPSLDSLTGPGWASLHILKDWPWW